MFRLPHTAGEHQYVPPHEPINISDKFDGQKHFSLNRWIWGTNPGPQHLEGQTASIWYRHRDVLNRVTYMPRDLLRYISPTYGKPFYLVVQATREVLEQDQSGCWKRKPVEGHAPTALRLSSWALKEVIKAESIKELPWPTIAKVVGKVLVAGPVQMLLVLTPLGNGEARVRATYVYPPHRTWEYPMYARNPLDAKPQVLPHGHQGPDKTPVTAKLYSRLLKPQRLYYQHQEGGQWQQYQNVEHVPYVFISYTRKHFDDKRPDQPDGMHAPCTMHQLHKVARRLAIEAGCNAYWMDDCIRDETPEELTEDIHRISDLVRGAVQVCVVVPDLGTATLQEWGRRVWTFPEALLAPNSDIPFATIQNEVCVRSRMSLSVDVWENDETARALVEHFQGTVVLSRLELTKLAIDAFSDREFNRRRSELDPAYALMGLLNQRPKPGANDNLFQALARLSMANDSDRLVERMWCMLPKPLQHGDVRSWAANRQFVLEDDLQANLWDIEPLHQVAGICEGKAIMIDGCRGADIRWKDIPSIAFATRESFKRSMVGYALRSGFPWLFVAAVMLGLGAATKAVGVLFLIIAFSLIFATPWSVMVLYGGKVWGATPWLIGIEGVMPIDKVEKLTFGNAIGRFTYSAGSTIYACSHPTERIGKKIDWIDSDKIARPELPPGHRFFTLIDTGTMTVTVFSARKPPTVALLAGREGGMLRVVLCSYDRASDTLFKETVIRMDSKMEDKAALLGWVKVA